MRPAAVSGEGEDDMSAKGRKAETALETLLRLAEKDRRTARRLRDGSAEHGNKVYWSGQETAFAETAARIRRLMKREARGTT